MNNYGTGAKKFVVSFPRDPSTSLLATAMPTHRTYGFAFFKGVATRIHTLRNPCKQVAPLCIDRMTKFSVAPETKTNSECAYKRYVQLKRRDNTTDRELVERSF